MDDPSKLELLLSASADLVEARTRLGQAHHALVELGEVDRVTAVVNAIACIDWCLKPRLDDDDGYSE